MPVEYVKNIPNKHQCLWSIETSAPSRAGAVTPGHLIVASTRALLGAGESQLEQNGAHRKTPGKILTNFDYWTIFVAQRTRNLWFSLSCPTALSQLPPRSLLAPSLFSSLTAFFKSSLSAHVYFEIEHAISYLGIKTQEYEYYSCLLAIFRSFYNC